jgi:hypothetical protein
LFKLAEVQVKFSPSRLAALALLLFVGLGAGLARAQQTGCGFWFATVAFGNDDRRISNTFSYCNAAPMEIRKALSRVVGDPKAFIGPNGHYASREEAEKYRQDNIAILKNNKGYNPTPVVIPDPLQ